MPTMAAIGIGGGAIASAGANIFGGIEQSNAAKAAIAAQQQMYQTGLSTAGNYFNTAQNILSPYISSGTNALESLMKKLPGLTKPFSAASLPSTPGYQFTLDQGLKGVQNSYAAQGLGESGAAEKGASDYATGEAQSTYQQQFQNYLAQNQQIANLLLGPAAIGGNAAGGLAGGGIGIGEAALGGAVTTGSGIATSTQNVGTALASGATGATNALTGGVNNALLFQLLSSKNGLAGLTGSGAGLSNLFGGTNAYTAGAFATNPASSPANPFVAAGG